MTSLHESSPGRTAKDARSRRRVSIAVLALVALTPPGAVEGGPVLCPVRRATGRPCPGCGLTRALVHLAHGDLRAAVRYHPMGPVLGLLLIAWACSGEAHADTALDPQRWTEGRFRKVALGAVTVGWLGWASRRATTAMRPTSSVR